jgi:hypothetical protein
MELFFPLIGVGAFGIAALAAVCCILIPGPKHLVSKVFFGTFAFLFGGAVLTFIVVVFALSATLAAHHLHPREGQGFAVFGVIYVLTGAASAWLSIRLLNSVYKAIDVSRQNKQKTHSDLPTEDHF